MFEKLKGKAQEISMGIGIAGATALSNVCHADSILTPDMVSGINTDFSASLTTLVPVGISIMGAMIGVKLIPRVVYTFL